MVEKAYLPAGLLTGTLAVYTNLSRELGAKLSKGSPGIFTYL